MDQTYIEDSELLYRAISQLSHLKHLDHNRQPTHTIFLNNAGVSVDRDGDRPEIDCIKALKNSIGPKYGGAVVISAGSCREVGTYPFPDPRDHNINHAHICNSDNRIDYSIDVVKAVQLINSCRIIECL